MNTTSHSWAAVLTVVLTALFRSLFEAQAGPLHHFDSRFIASPQRVGDPFEVLLTARDATNGTVEDFTNTVAFTANSDSDLRSAPLLGNLAHQDFSFNQHGPVSAGFAFTPNTDITVTHVRHYSGGRISIWTDAGVLLAAREVADFGGLWVETPLYVPLVLSAGTTYRVTLWSGSFRYYWRTSSVTNFAGGLIGPSYTASSDIFPQSVIPSRTWLVDLRYTAGSSNFYPITPAVSGNFVGGAWTGNVAVLQATAQARLKVQDDAGHLGASNPFIVVAQDDLVLAATTPLNVLPRGDLFTWQVTLSNTGPSVATSVIVSNRFSGPVTNVSITASQGTTWIAGNSIVWSLDVLAGTMSSTLQVASVATNAGVAALHASVKRGEIDGAYDNNAAVEVVSILNRPSLSVNDVTLVENDTGSTNAILSVQLSLPTVQTVAVNYATSPGNAAVNVDYQAGTGTLVFSPGVTNLTLPISVNGDFLSESNEFFFVNLSSASNATIARAQGRVTINDNEPLAALTITDVTVTEGNSGTTNAVFAVQLSTVSGRTVTVGYQTANASALAGSDYTTRSGTLTFSPGNTNQTISVPVTGDILGESNETFLVNLSNPVNATLADAQGIGTIVNNDPLTIFINDAAIQEANDAIYASFTVWLSPPTNKTVVVSYATANGTALAGVDYASASGSLIFSSGITTQTLQVVIYGDLTNEATKSFFVNLSSPVNGTIADGQGVCTITDNDPLPVFTVSSVSTVEGHTGTTNLVFQVQLLGLTERTATVNYAATDGTATGGSDYLATNGSLAFPPGTTNLPVSVTVLGDRLVESNEVFGLTLSGAVNASVVNAGAGTILNDDGLPGQLHHFEWITIPSPQLTGMAFTAGISARDLSNNLVTDFTGAVNLFARTSSPTAILFQEDFEDGNLDGWSPSFLTVDRYIANQFAAGGTNSLYLGWNPTSHTFSNLTPSRINFYVRTDTATGFKGYFVVGSGPNNEDTAAFFYMDNGGQMGLFTESSGWHPAPYQLNQWYKISLRFNWQDRRLDYLVNDALVEANIPFRGPTVSNLTQLRLDGYVSCWWDQIEFIGSDLVPAPGLVSPSVTGNFTNGTWAGNLALGTVATNVILGATNDDGFVGFSNPFEIGYPNDLILLVHPGTSSTFVGDTLTYLLTLKATGPGTLSGVVLSNMLPAGVTFLSATTSQGGWSRGGAVVNWNAGDLSPGTNAVLSILVRADAVGWLTNRAGASLAGSDPNPLNNSVTLPIRVEPALHHFVFNTLTTTQQSQSPFPITLTARDLNNKVISNFSGSVSLNATRLFQDDFEDANLDGWTSDGGVFGSQIVITNTLGGTNNQALNLEGTPGVSHDFPNLAPAQVMFKVRLAAPDGNIFCTLASGPNENQRIVHFRMSGGVMYVYYAGAAASYTRAFTTDRWYQISFQFNWVARTYSWFVDGALVAANIPFYGSNANLLANASLYNWFGCISWWDDFELLGDVAVNNVIATPATLGPFSNGVWAGAVELQQAAANVQLRVTDGGGRIGLSRPFNVGPGDHGVFDHFDWSPIGSRLVNQPFAASLTARDKFGSLVTNFNGTANLRAVGNQPVRVLIFSAYAAPSSVQGPIDVISNWSTNFTAMTTTNTAAEALRAELKEQDVFLIASQTQATSDVLNPLPGSWAGVLSEFTSRGGIVISLSGSAWVNDSGLLACAPYGAGGTFNLTKSTNHILTDGITTPFYGPGFLGYFFNTNGTKVLEISAGGDPVVLSRDIGLGHAVVLGSAMGSASGTAFDQVFVNAIKWAQMSGLNPLPLSPTNTGPFSNGVWTGTITISTPADRVFLQADDSHLNAAFSNPFSVGVINDIGVTMVLSNTLAIAGQPLDFLLTLTNVGPNPATGVWLTNVVPPGTAFVGATTSQGSCFLAGSNMVCDVGLMTNGSSVNLTLTLLSPLPGVFTNAASVTRAEPDYFTGNNSAVVVATVIPPTSFYISNATVVEGNSGVTNAQFEIRLYPPTAQTASVNYVTIDGSAQAGLDYVATNAVLTFLPGVTNQFITVAVTGDLVSENTELFSVQLSNPTNALLGAATATGTILDNNDALPLLFVDAASALEGDTGANALTFSARLSTLSGRPVTVGFATANGTAITGSDFENASGQLTFPPGVTNQTFTVDIRGDTVNEADEFFLVNISSVSNATAAFGQSSGLIRNDDGRPGKLDHFELSPVMAPVVQNQPFWLTVNARDAWNYALPNVNGPFTLEGHRGASSNTLEVLTWTRWVLSGRYPQILTAISNWYPAFHEVSTTTLDPSVLEALLSDKDVLLIPPQGAPTGQMGILGTSWSTVLNQFVDRGGVVIVCSDNYDEHLLLVNSGFLQLQRLGNDFSGNVTIGSSSRVTAGVSNSFTGPFVTTYAASNGLVAVKTTAANYAVVIQRESGLGAAFMIGSGFFAPGSQMDLVLANAVRWNLGDGIQPVTVTGPGLPLILTNGTWSAQIAITQPGTQVTLRASDDLEHEGWLSLTEVLADSDGDGMPDPWEDAAELNRNDPADAVSDADGDGASNFAEFLAGTDPQSPDSALRLWVSKVDNSLWLHFPSAYGRRYVLESCPDPIQTVWAVTGSAVIGNGAVQQFVVPITDGQLQQCYRVRLLP